MEKAMIKYDQDQSRSLDIGELNGFFHLPVFLVSFFWGGGYRRSKRWCVIPQKMSPSLFLDDLVLFVDK